MRLLYHNKKVLNILIRIKLQKYNYGLETENITPDADAIHRSLLVGLLSNVGNWDERRREYAGARGTRFTIWPGSGLRRKTYN